MDNNKIREIENIIDYQFSQKGHLIQAFTRRSYSEENPGNPCNEIMETLGDSVIGLYVTKALLQRYRGATVTEGGISKMRAAIVNGANLAKHAVRLGLAKKEYMLLGKGDITQKVYEKSSVQEDLLESIVGAVALDCDYDQEQLSITVNHLLDIEHLEQPWKNYITSGITTIRNSAERGDNHNPVNYLQELWRSGNIPMPNYEDRGHYAEGWICVASILEMGLILVGEGKSKKQAKLNAAQKLYDEVVKAR